MTINSNKNLYYYKGVNPTVDLVIKNPDNEILVIRRSKTSNACPSMFAFPGGFIDSKALEGTYWESGFETPQMAALRELKEEANLELKLSTELVFVGVYEGNSRDPRDSELSWSKSYVFYYEIPKDIFNAQKNQIIGQDDAEFAKWIPISELSEIKLAFDHNKILSDIIFFLTNGFTNVYQ